MITFCRQVEEMMGASGPEETETSRWTQAALLKQSEKLLSILFSVVISLP
jgi:hypothetical protein